MVSYLTSLFLVLLKLTSLQLTLENEELKVSSHLTQTDHLNKQLLLSFMNNMDSLNYRWQDEQKDDEWDEDSSPNNNDDDDLNANQDT